MTAGRRPTRHGDLALLLAVLGCRFLALILASES
jgi:hypothetical protein